MASLSYTTHPSSQTSYSFTLSNGSSDAKYFYFISKYYVTDISTISVPQQISDSNADTQYRWNNSCAWGGSSTSSGSTRNSGLINNFNKSRQILCARVQCTNNSGSSKKFTLTAPTISATGTIQTLSTVSTGDQIDNADMAALKTYLDGYCSGTNIGTSYTLADITAGATINNSNLSSYVNKANALPHVSGLSAPSEGASITAAYYNNIVNKVKP